MNGTMMPLFSVYSPARVPFSMWELRKHKHSTVAESQSQTAEDIFKSALPLIGLKVFSLWGHSFLRSLQQAGSISLR